MSKHHHAQNTAESTCSCSTCRYLLHLFTLWVVYFQFILSAIVYKYDASVCLSWWFYQQNSVSSVGIGIIFSCEQTQSPCLLAQPIKTMPFTWSCCFMGLRLEVLVVGVVWSVMVKLYLYGEHNYVQHAYGAPFWWHRKSCFFLKFYICFFSITSRTKSNLCDIGKGHCGSSKHWPFTFNLHNIEW